MSQTSLSVIPCPEHGRVLILVNGKLVAEIPHQAAYRVSKLMAGAAKICENMADPHALIQSQAELIAMGVPIALSSDLRIKDGAEKILRHSKTLKQASAGMGFSAGYQGVVSSPTVQAHPPK